jgi:hypothetical protein
MPTRRLLTRGPSDEPMWVQLHITHMGHAWCAMILADDEQPPKPEHLKGLAFFGTTPEEAEGAAFQYLEGRGVFS